MQPKAKLSVKFNDSFQHIKTTIFYHSIVVSYLIFSSKLLDLFVNKMRDKGMYFYTQTNVLKHGIFLHINMVFIIHKYMKIIILELLRYVWQLKYVY